MTTKTGKELSALLATIRLNEPGDPNANGIPSDLWACMPDQASGREWVGFMVSVAEDIADTLSDGDEYEFDDLTESVMEHADNNSPVYYAGQFEQISLLGLWALDEVEEGVTDRLAPDNCLTLRALMPHYCAMAYEITWLAICNYVMSEEAN